MTGNFSDHKCLKCNREHNITFWPLWWKNQAGFFCQNCWDDAVADPKVTMRYRDGQDYKQLRAAQRAQVA